MIANQVQTWIFKKMKKLRTAKRASKVPFSSRNEVETSATKNLSDFWVFFFQFFGIVFIEADIDFRRVVGLWLSPLTKKWQCSISSLVFHHSFWPFPTLFFLVIVYQRRCRFCFACAEKCLWTLPDFNKCEAMNLLKNITCILHNLSWIPNRKCCDKNCHSVVEIFRLVLWENILPEAFEFTLKT